MRRGITIAAEREKPVQESERMQERKRVRTRKTWRILLVLVFFGVLAWLMISGVRGLIDLLSKKSTNGSDGGSGSSAYVLEAEIIDETGAGVTSSMRTFIERMERDLAEYGYELERAVLPVGKMRQVDLYLTGKDGYIKVRSDRGAGEQAEDIDRMLRYLGDGEFEYIDVRVEGKGYWK